MSRIDLEDLTFLSNSSLSIPTHEQNLIEEPLVFGSFLLVVLVQAVGKSPFGRVCVDYILQADIDGHLSIWRESIIGDRRKKKNKIQFVLM
jgi:hypothetical protein